MLLECAADVNRGHFAGVYFSGVGPELPFRGSLWAAALWAAARFGSAGAVRALLDAKAGLDDGARSGALLTAAENGHVEVVQAIVNAKVDVEPVAGNTPLSEAARGGHCDVIAVLLQAKAALDQTDEGVDRGDATPVIAAIESGQIRALECLARAKADVDKAGQFARTPLCAAVHQHNSRAVKLLVSAKADVDKAAHNGVTPTLIAAQVRARVRLGGRVVALILRLCQCGVRGRGRSGG